MIPARRLAGSDLSYISLAILSRAANVATVILLTITMRLDAFGALMFIQASILFATNLASLNLPASLQVIVPKWTDPDIALHNSLLLGMMTASALLSAMIAVIMISLAPDVLASDPLGLVLAGMLAFLSCLQMFLPPILFARGMPRRSAIATGISPVLVGLATITLSVRELGDAMRLLVGANLIGVTVMAYSAFHEGIERKLARLRSGWSIFFATGGRDLLGFSIPILLTGYLYQFTVWYLQQELVANAGLAESAVYSVSLQFYNVVMFLQMALVPLMLGRMVRTDDGKVQSQTAIRMTLGLLAMALASFLVLEVVKATLPPDIITYPGFELEAVVLAVYCAGAMIIKSPLSVFFQVRLDPKPDAISGILASVAMLSVPLIAGNDYSAIMVLESRLAGFLVILATVVACFVSKLKASR